MLTWYTLVVSRRNDSTIDEIHRAIEAQFSSNRPANFAVFGQVNRDAEHETIWFSPAAEPLAMIFGAQPCARPGRTEVTVLSGYRSEIFVLFA